MYGKLPPIHLPYFPRESNIELVDKSLAKREEMLNVIKFHLKRAQERMKQVADRHKSDRKYEIGDRVYVKLQSYIQILVSFRPNAKLSPKYFGPYQILDKVGEVSYKLGLLVNSKIHNVFHVSQLKKYVGDIVVTTEFPYQAGERLQEKELETILDRMTVKKKENDSHQIACEMEAYPSRRDYMEFYYDFNRKYPSLFTVSIRR